MNARVAPRLGKGQPVLMLALVLTSWAAMRAALWESPFPSVRTIAEQVMPQFVAAPGLAEPVLAAEPAEQRVTFAQAKHQGAAPLITGAVPFSIAALSPPPAGGEPSLPSFVMRGGAAHSQAIWLAGMRQLSFSARLAKALSRKAIAADNLPAMPRIVVNSGEATGQISRWGFDGWVLYRQGSAQTLAAGARPASYGASQAGAALRYRLDRGSARRPEAYLRVTSALAIREREAAVGLSARPFAQIPIRAAAELRLFETGASGTGGQTSLRPAAFVHTELPPVKLPAGLKAQAYAQAGYVGGDFATEFADGQAAVTRQLAKFDLGRISAGAGVWGGAQKGASRVDVGPTAALDMRLGQVNARLSVDYRKRVAGNAKPGDGVAVTLSSGF